ncbi:MAG: insulinase family protein [Ruminococcaceae bacterium]|nr:insulinase family protein [Oscillospiraceae bacterium]
MSVKRIELTKGVYLNVVDTPKFKNNYLSVSFASPLSRETASMNALLPLILTRGTVSYPTMEKMSIALDTLYASTINTRCFKKGEIQFCGFNCGILNNSYAPDGCDIIGGTLDILHEVIFRPYLEDGVFSVKYLETEKQNLCDRIAAQINNKNSYAMQRANEEMCKDEAYGISSLGYAEDIEKVDADTLYKHYLELIDTARVEIFFVGSYSEDIGDKIKSTLDFKPREPIALETKVIRKASEIKNIQEPQPVTQAKLTLGFRTGKVLSDGDFYKFVVFNSIFSSSPTSKLFMNVREKLSLCYYCRSVPEPQKGVMLVAAGIEKNNREKAYNEILNQLNDIVIGNISDDELLSAKSSILNSYRELDDSPEGMENWYLGRMLAGMNDSPAEVSEQVMTVTKEDISSVAKEITLDTVYFMDPTLEGEAEDDE